MALKKIIITTTIGSPTKEIRVFDAMSDWHLIVTGDRKTPTYKLKRGEFISWKQQVKDYPELCELVGADNTVRGRMIALLEAHKRKADLVASIDDDCMPYRGWPGPIYVGKKVRAQFIRCNDLAFDPVRLSYNIPSRGFPPQLSWGKLEFTKFQMREIKPLVQVNFWDGQADVDAVYRLHGKFDNGLCNSFAPYWTNTFSPVDTQNTIIHGSVLKDYCGEIPFVGHVSDIWAGYLFQAFHPNSTLYCPATVRHWQDRTYESVVKDLEGEIYSYRYGLEFLQSLKQKGRNFENIMCLPNEAVAAINLYRSYFK